MTDIPATVRAIASIYDAEAAARATLVNIGYPVAAIPPWIKPELFWSAIILDLDRGRIQNGIAKLVIEALKEYPANRQLQQLCSGINKDSTFPDFYTSGPQMISPPSGPSYEIDSDRELARLSTPNAPEASFPRVERKRIPGSAGPARKRWLPAFVKRTDRDLQISLRNLKKIHPQSGQRRLEPLSPEQYDFDNSESSATSVETLRIFNSTQLVLKFDLSRATLRDGQSSVSILDFAKVQGQLKSKLLSQYSLTQQTTLTVERTSQINIPARAHVRVVLNWKRVWQDGIVVLRTRSGDDVEFPYSVTVDLIFDKTLTDIS
jgi:hypothetical protein